MNTYVIIMDGIVSFLSVRPSHDEALTLNVTIFGDRALER